MIDTLYDCFKHWSKSGSVYILSDLHLEDSDCKLMDENWISPQEQIDIINKTVMKTDTLICLGDVGNPIWLDKLKCQYRVLLMGNHDQSKKKFKPYFNEIYDGALFISDKILLSHEPIYGLPFCLNIHGHDHSGYKHNGYDVIKDIIGNKHLNLASNVCGYTPISLGKLIKNGALSGIDSIHRLTIDRANERKKWREKNNKTFEEGYKEFS